MVVSSRFTIRERKNITIRQTSSVFSTVTDMSAHERSELNTSIPKLQVPEEVATSSEHQDSG